MVLRVSGDKVFISFELITAREGKSEIFSRLAICERISVAVTFVVIKSFGRKGFVYYR